MSKLLLPEGGEFDLDLGTDHYLQWVSHSDDEIVGAIIYHPWPEPKPDPENWTPWCAGSVWFKADADRKRHLWNLEGKPDEHLTLSPSIACDCGDHGYIRRGKWERV